MGYQKHRKKVYLEILRILAILLVIFNHTDGYYQYYSNTTNLFTWLFSVLGSVVCRINVPLFLMITGALLLDRKEPIKEIYQKRIFRIASVLFIFSVFYYVIAVARGRNTGASVMDFLRRFLQGSVQESFWYLYLYLGVLIVLPFLRKLAESLENREFLYLLLLQLFAGIGIQILEKVTGIQINDNLYLINIYSFYVLSGYFLGNRIQIETIGKRQCLAIAGGLMLEIAVATGIIVWDYHQTGIYDQACIGLLSPILTLGIFFCIRWLCSRYRLPRWLESLVLFIGSCVLGIYLLEQFTRIQLLPLYLYLTEKSIGIVACSCYVIGSFLFALAYTILLKRIPGIKRLL